VFLVFTSLFVKAQSKQGITGTLHMAHGTVLRHTSDIEALGDVSVNSLYLDLGLPTQGRFAWSEYYGNPYLGFSLIANKYSSSAIGSSISAIAYLENQKALFNSNVYAYYHIGFGLGYVENVFDIETNFNNQVVGTHLNAVTEMRIGLGYKLTNAWLIRAGGYFFHASNMGFKKPNYGINLPSLGASVQYVFPNSAKRKAVDKKQATSKNRELILELNVGTRQIAYDDPYLLVGNLIVDQQWRLSDFFKLGIGLAIIDDGLQFEHKKYMQRLEPDGYQEIAYEQSLSGGTHVAMELLFGKLSIVGSLGYYVWHPYRAFREDPTTTAAYETYMDYTNATYTYSRLGFRYRLTPNWLLSITGKTQLAKVQFMQLGVGRSF
jgi:hypothetical protein